MKDACLGTLNISIQLLINSTIDLFYCTYLPNIYILKSAIHMRTEMTNTQMQPHLTYYKASQNKHNQKKVREGQNEQFTSS